MLREIAQLWIEGMTEEQIAAKFSVSLDWLGLVLNSDGFKVLVAGKRPADGQGEDDGAV